MLIHIVKTGETIERIASSYHISRGDLIANNLHITDFTHLKSGMKVKIPILSKQTNETLEETEAFIDDYYPSFEKFVNNNAKITKDIVMDDVKVENNNDIKQKMNIEPINTNIDVNEQIKLEPINANFEIKEEIKAEKKEQVKEQKIINKEVIKTASMEKTSTVQMPYNYGYYGNVVPEFDSRFIRKI